MDGSWSVDFSHPHSKDQAIVKGGHRPHIFYFALLDCSRNFEKTYSKGSLPRVLTELTILNGDNHFSYEDMGLLSLHVYMSIGMTLLFGLMIKQYIAYYQDFERLLSPHPIMIYSLGAQLLALIL